MSQKHISDKEGQRYPCSKAIDLFNEVEDLGFVEVNETISSKNKKKVSLFRKRRYETLSSESVIP